MDGEDLAAGAENLIENCAELKPHESLLVICEDPALGWYDAAAPDAVIQRAREIGVTPSILHVGTPTNEADPAVDDAIAAHDCTIYFSRIGDQDRFADPVPGKKSVMCYVRTKELLSSAYGTTSHLAYKDLKRAIDQATLNAGHVEITCPLGTSFSGTVSAKARLEKTDVSVRRFPLAVPMPIEAAGFSGQVALTHFLSPTGSKTYEPAGVELSRVSVAHVEKGHIREFTGDEHEVAQINAHYDMVAGKFGIERDVVHSWHAGIHPGCAYPLKASDDVDRWSNTVFANPRFVHFHTCGNYAPGEICWMVLDHTIALDGVNLWEKGRLQPGNFSGTRACLDKWPELTALFDNPSDEIGLS